MSSCVGAMHIQIDDHSNFIEWEFFAEKNFLLKFFFDDDDDDHHWYTRGHWRGHCVITTIMKMMMTIIEAFFLPSFYSHHQCGSWTNGEWEDVKEMKKRVVGGLELGCFRLYHHHHHHRFVCSLSFIIWWCLPFYHWQQIFTQHLRHMFCLVCVCVCVVVEFFFCFFILYI